MAELPGSNNQTFPGHCPLYQGALFLLSLMYQSLSLTFKKKKKRIYSLIHLAPLGLSCHLGDLCCVTQGLSLWSTDSPVVAHWPQSAWASVVAGYRLLSSSGVWARQLWCAGLDALPCVGS